MIELWQKYPQPQPSIGKYIENYLNFIKCLSQTRRHITLLFALAPLPSVDGFDCAPFANIIPRNNSLVSSYGMKCCMFYVFCFFELWCLLFVSNCSFLCVIVLGVVFSVLFIYLLFDYGYVQWSNPDKTASANILKTIPKLQKKIVTITSSFY